jgi:hypothetical protein
MSWYVIILAAAGAFALYRIYVSLRKLQDRSNDDWDARLIERLRLSGSDPFQPHDVDFFFALPNEVAAKAVAARLEKEGYSVDLRTIPEVVDQPCSVHARKSLRLSVPGMREISRGCAALAREHGGRYDGWAATRVPRAD